MSGSMIRFVALAFAGFLIAWSSVCAASRQVVFNTDDCLLAINLARTASLKVSVPAVLAGKSRSEDYLRSLLKSGGNLYMTYDDTDCSVYPDVSPLSLGGLVLNTGGVKQPDAKTIAQLIQKELDEGLKVIGYSYQEKLDPRGDIYSNFAAQNLAFLLHSTATDVICAVPSNCEKGQSVVLCLFDRNPATGEAPFTEAFLEALQARKAANVDIANLFEQRMQRNPSGKEGTETPIPGAASAVPCTLPILLFMFALLLAH